MQVHDTAAHEAVGREPAVEVARAADWRFEGPPADRDAQLRDARRAQTRRHLYDDLQRVEGVLYHRLREGMQDKAQFKMQKEKLQRAIAESLLDK